MQRTARLFWSILPLCAGLVGCQEPNTMEPSSSPGTPPGEEQSPTSVVTPSPLPSDPVAQLQGFVTDLSGSPLEGVEVRVNGTLLAQTSPEGAFVVPDLPPNGQAHVEVSRDGFSSSVRSIALDASDPATLRFSLQPTRDAVLDFAELGGTVSLPDGLELDVPPQAVVDASGLPVSGPVQLEYTLLDDPDELPWLQATSEPSSWMAPKPCSRALVWPKSASSKAMSRSSWVSP